MMGKPERLALSAVVAVALASGCAHDTGGSPARSDPGELRTDPAPLTSRVPELGHDFTVQWYGGILGDERTPGPSTYWVEALVTPDGTVDDLAGDVPLSPRPAPAPDELAELLPQCQWEGSDAIDAEWGATEWSATVWFCREYNQVVVSLLGGA